MLLLFVTFLVMNPITFDVNISFVGKYGKLLVALSGILILQKSFVQLNNFVAKNVWLIFFWALCIGFALFRILEKGVNFDLIQQNILFIVFVYFYYLLSLKFKSRYRVPNYFFLKYLARAINFNLFFWTAIVFLFSFDIWHTAGDRTGLGLFYGSYIQFGIFACVGAIANFSLLRYRIKDNRKFYFVMSILYGILVFLSGSRNAQLVLLVFLLLYLMPYLKRIAIGNIYLVVFSLSIVSVFYFSGEMLLNESLTDLSSGRSSIWYYIYEYYTQNSILRGEGIFGLNTTILDNNLDTNYYLQRIDFLYFHSSFVELIGASGILGFLFFMLFVIRSLKRKRKFYVVNIVVSILFGGMFESFLVQPTVLISFLFWYFIIQRTEEEDSMSNQPQNKLEPTIT